MDAVYTYTVGVHGPAACVTDIDAEECIVYAVTVYVFIVLVSFFEIAFAKNYLYLT